MGLRGVWICSTRSDALIGSIGHDGSLSANHWRRGHIASEDHGWFRHRPLMRGAQTRPYDAWLLCFPLTLPHEVRGLEGGWDLLFSAQWLPDHDLHSPAMMVRIAPPAP